MSKLFLGLITRCKDEFFIKEFCDYYISQGVDKIYIIDDNSDDKSIYDNIKDEKVAVVYENNIFVNQHQMSAVNKIFNKIRQDFEWLISVDVDEFITTKKNIDNTIREELQLTFNNIDCVKIPWVMMSCNKLQKNPESVLQTNIYRWNHDKKHPHPVNKFRCRYNQIEVKCIFKCSKFDFIDVHHPSRLVGDCVIVDSIRCQKQNIDSFYDNLRENDIKNGYLLCYHYRIISRENNANKLKKAQYLKFTLDDLMKSDHPEVSDKTLKIKTQQHNYK